MRSRTRTPRAQNRPNFIVAVRGVSRNGRPMVPAIAVHAKNAKLNARDRAHFISEAPPCRVPTLLATGSATGHGQGAPALRQMDEQGWLSIYRIRSPAAPRFATASTNVRARSG